MALGSNLKKKQLIPDPSKESKPTGKTQKKAQKGKKSLPEKTKRVAKKKPAGKVATPKPTPIKATQASPASEPKTEQAPATVERQEAAATANQPLQSVDVIPSVNSSPPVESRQGENEQIISAYSIYIAKQLHERKTALREKYLKEVTELRGKPIQVILIVLGTERYALDIDCIKEVVPLPAISKTPNTPSHVQGVVNVRGNTYVVFDLAAKFKVLAQEVPRYLLVLSNNELKSSVPLSVLPTTFKTNGDQISHSLQTIEDTLLDASYIKGIIHDNEELIYYLDIVELLKNEKAIVMPDNLVEEK